MKNFNLRLLFVGIIALALVASAFVFKIERASAQSRSKQTFAPTAAFTVTNTNDSGAGSLRQAILDANAAANTGSPAILPDVISFAITGGTAPYTIQPLTELPAVTEAVDINGYTQSGAVMNPNCGGTATIQIVLNGALAGTGSNGLTLMTGSSTVRGLAINNFDGNGIEIMSGTNIVTGNFIGTNAAGTAAVPNNTNGVIVTAGAANQIGGITPATRNIISGNAGRGIVVNGFGGARAAEIRGNYIGTNAAGTAALGNAFDGISISQSSNNLIGGGALQLGCAPGNLISGNGEDGVDISGTGAAGNIVQGNFIGTAAAAGITALPNMAQGVYLNAVNNQIGGIAPTSRNIISGNNGGGVNIGGGSGNLVQGNYIGTNLTGTAALRNPDGVRIDNNANGNTVGGASFAGITAYGIDTMNRLVRFSVAAPSNVTTIGAVSGLQANEIILGIDFRPATGQLYGLGSTSRLYTINLTTAAATQVGTAPLATPLNGTEFGFDFNPTVDRIRVVSDTGQNLRLNPNTGGIAAVDGAINGGALGATAAGYTGNDVDNATATTLYVIDTVSDALYIQNPPNNGTLVLVGALNANGSNGNVTERNGFDIVTSGTTNTAYAALQVGSIGSLYTIDLTTGAATPVGFLSGSPLRGFAVEPAPDAALNVISGNDVGVNIGEAANNFVRGNLIGTAADGTTDVGNFEAGVYIHDAASTGNIIGGTNAGEGNTIRFNGNGALIANSAGEGGIIVYFGATGNSLFANRINDNTGLGIDLTAAIADGVTANDGIDADSGAANNYQNFPTLTSATSSASGSVVQGVLTSTPSRTFRIEFFSVPTADASGNGEGLVYLGATAATTNAAGVIMFTANVPQAVSIGQFISATATDSTTGDTSEFSAPRVVSVTTAAAVTITGQITAGKGYGIKGARLTLTSANGESRTETTNLRGNYQFDNVAADSNYVISVAAKRHSFNPSSQLLEVRDNLTGVNFVSEN